MDDFVGLWPTSVGQRGIGDARAGESFYGFFLSKHMVLNYNVIRERNGGAVQ